MKNFRFYLLVLAGLFAARLPMARAQNFSINWSTIDGGGGSSSGGAYSMSSTIGQPDAGPTLTGGNFSVTGGFWTFSAVQSVGAPLLTISLTATNTILVSWPSPSTGFNLQQNTNLSGGTWTTPAETVNDDGTTKSVVVSSPTDNRFYRLLKP